MNDIAKENIFKRIIGFFKRITGAISNKTKPAREFMRSGRLGAMVLETVVALPLLSGVLYDSFLMPFPYIVSVLGSVIVFIIVAELLNLAVKILFSGGKRCKSYFLLSFVIVMMINIMATQSNAFMGAVIVSFMLVLSVDILGRIIVGFIKTHRFKQVFAYLAGTISIAYLVLFAFFYFNDNLGESRIEFYNAIKGINDNSVPGFSNTLENGSFNVKTLSYGPDETDDILTDILDLSDFEVEGGSIITSLRKATDDIELSQTPIKGQIWYPEGERDCPVFFIVHGNHAANVPSYLGYDYLGEYLASNGYVVVSVDENIINALEEGNDLRAYILLENMKTILNMSKENGNPLSGLIDEDKIAIGGHSRGGEMVASAYLFNSLDVYPENGNIKFDYDFNITSIVAISPVVDQYKPLGRSVEISDVNYLLLHGANDQDVSIMMGEKQYNNISFTKSSDDYYFKASTYILGANHGQFNSLWGQYDMPFAIGYLNTYNFLDEAEQKLIAKAYIRTFLDATLLGDDTYISLFCDADSYAADLPDTIYITNFEDSDTDVICSFDNTVDIVNYESGATIDVAGADDWTLTSYERGFGGEKENYVLYVSWSEESEPAINISFSDIDISDGYISFAMADMREETEDIDEMYDYSITITDASGRKATITHPIIIYPTLAVQLYKEDVLFGSYEYKHQLQTVTISPEMFDDSEIDFSAITELTITTDGSEYGDLIVDNICYCSH